MGRSHERIRNQAKRNEMEPSKHLRKEQRFFLPPPKDGSDVKELFKRLAAAGAGRPADKDGFPAGPWTPELLVEAISRIDGNREGIDLRTVQLWFQDNDKGISTNNVRWLARIFGCGDPAATIEWQIELSAAQERMTAKRRQQRRARSCDAPREPDVAQLATFHDEVDSPIEGSGETYAAGPLQGFSLASRLEALFSSRSSLELPALVFAGAVALGFFSYIVNIHNILFDPADSPAKQVGFLWAPNWTVLFLVILPLYLMTVGELLVFWKDEGRAQLTSGREHHDNDWKRNVEAFSYSYWASLLICLPVAAVSQWINECFVPLMMSEPGNFGVDWGRIAIIRPDIISVPEAVAFTGIAYLYMGVCFFMFFAGLILLCTLVHDLSKIEQVLEVSGQADSQSVVRDVGFKVMQGIFRCTILGLLIAICMKLQNMFMLSSAETIVSWLIFDFLSAVKGSDVITDRLAYSRPTLYSSFLVVLTTSAVFLHGTFRIHRMLVRSESVNAAHGTNSEQQRERTGGDYC